MKKTILFILLVLMLAGCTKNTEIKKYNELSSQHQEETEMSFHYLSESLKTFNEKKFDQSISYAQKCIDAYEKVVILSQDGKDVAKNAKLDAWIQDFKKISIDSEKIRIQQCELLKSASSESKQLNPDHEIVAKTINEISDLNDQFNKLQKTLNDMQNQYSKNFK